MLRRKYRFAYSDGVIMKKCDEDSLVDDYLGTDKEPPFMGWRIKELRKNKGLTQAQLYDAIDFGTADENKHIMISRIENGQMPTAEVFYKLCDYFQCDPDYLRGVTNQKTRDISFIAKYTGLSENAINNLHALRNSSEKLLNDFKDIPKKPKVKSIVDGERDMTEDDVRYNISGRYEKILEKLNCLLEYDLKDIVHLETDSNTLIEQISEYLMIDYLKAIEPNHDWNATKVLRIYELSKKLNDIANSMEKDGDLKSLWNCTML